MFIPVAYQYDTHALVVGHKSTEVIRESLPISNKSQPFTCRSITQLHVAGPRSLDQFVVGCESPSRKAHEQQYQPARAVSWAAGQLGDTHNITHFKIATIGSQSLLTW